MQRHVHNFCKEDNESDIGGQNSDIEAKNLDTRLHLADFKEFNRLLCLAPAERNAS